MAAWTVVASTCARFPATMPPPCRRWGRTCARPGCGALIHARSYRRRDVCFRRSLRHLNSRMACQPALCAALDCGGVLGRQRDRRPAGRGPYSAGDACLPALGAWLPDHPSRSVETSQARLASDPHEAELIERAKLGNAQAFQALYDKHKRRVYSLCLRLTAYTAEAEDLTQEAFLQLYR